MVGTLDFFDDTRRHKVVEALQAVEYGLVHVEVLVGGEAAQEDHVGVLGRELAILFVDVAVLLVGYGIVRVADVRARLLADDRPVALTVGPEVLVLGDARELVVRTRVVDQRVLLVEAAVLELAAVQRHVLELDAAVLEGLETIRLFDQNTYYLHNYVKINCMQSEDIQ